MAFDLATRPITAPDPDGSKVPPVKCTGAAAIMVGATSDTKGAKLVFRIIFTDSLQNVQGCTPPVTLVASQSADWGALFLASTQDNSEPSFHAVADLAFVKVDSLTPATAKWILGADAR